MSLLYGLLKDIVRFFQDNWSLIISNTWTFLLFALIVAFFSVLICILVYKRKGKKLESKVAQIKEENSRLTQEKETLVAEIAKLNSQLDQYSTYRIIDKKSNNTNKEFTDQLIMEFSEEN